MNCYSISLIVKINVHILVTQEILVEGGFHHFVAFPCLQINDTYAFSVSDENQRSLSIFFHF